MKLEKKHSGLLANVLFREYLLLHFPNYCSEEQNGCLAYQAEYLLGGKKTDEKNLRYVVNRLLLLREGMNYLYCLENGEMSMQAQNLAAALTGFLGIPALTAATKHALLLAWAYGESLIDVRSLLAKGKVPIFKDDASWQLTLENLGRLTEILKEGKSGQQKGTDYTGYLRILLHMGNLSKQKLRGLDLIQCNLEEEGDGRNFLAENAIVAIRTETAWSCPMVFFGLQQSVMGIGGDGIKVKQRAGMAY